MLDHCHRVSMQQRYFSLCLSQIADYERIKNEIEQLEAKSVGEDEIHIVEMNLSALHENLEQAVVAPIISVAMALEAFSYDYAASNLGDSFVKKHLDKLDVPSRIVVATRLITGKSFPVGGKAFSGIKNLMKVRNKLVHFKSKKFSLSESGAASEFLDSLNSELEESMYEGRDALRALMRELDHLHDQKYKYEYSIESTQCHA